MYNTHSSAPQQDTTQKEIARYYKKSTLDYLLYYRSFFHQQMHFGFSRGKPKNLNPMENLVRYMGEVGGLKAGDLGLDAGCGLGGTSLVLSKLYDTKNIGITLVPEHCGLAKKFTQKKGLSSSCTFLVADYQIIPFPDQHFDYVIAIESFDHALDKKAWFSEISRVLKPQGKLLIADGFYMSGKWTKDELHRYGLFLRGWAVPYLCTPEEAQEWTQEVGLVSIHQENLTPEILPHAYNIYRFGSLFLPWRKFLQKLGWVSLENSGNAEATFHQYRTLERGVWNYWFFVWEKAKTQ